MIIEYWSDFACPFCYIAETRMKKALRELDISDECRLDFKAFELNQDAPKVPKRNIVEGFSHHFQIDGFQGIFFGNYTGKHQENGANASRNLNFENQRRRALNDRREEKKRQEKFNRIREKVQNDLNSVSRQDPHSGYLLKKKMRAVKSMEKRFEREAEDMTEAPEEENAAGE